MKYSNDIITGERIYRKIFEVKTKGNGKLSKFKGKEIVVTCACAQKNKKKFYGFSIQSPTELQTNRMLSLSPARGRLTKAIKIDQRMVFPDQRWVSRDQLISFVDDINKKRKKW